MLLSMKQILLTGTAANTPTVTAEDDVSGSTTSKSLIDAAAQASNPQQYKADATEGFVSSLTNAHIDNTGGTAEKNDFFVGFGYFHKKFKVCLEMLMNFDICEDVLKIPTKFHQNLEENRAFNQ